MPYCCQCGNTIGETDAYCARCGARQPVSPRTTPLSGLSPRTASVLCYIPFVGWIAAIVVLASEKFRNDLTVRFHAFQGLYLFVAWLIVDQVIEPLFRAIPGPGFFVPRVDKLLELALLIVWVFMLVKVGQDRSYSLPIIGELAERSAAGR